MLQHVRSKGCQWDSNILLEAAVRNKTAMLRWLREQEPSWGWPKDLVSKARSLGADECAQWAQEHGAPSDAAVTGAVAGAGVASGV
jgi:hypothetical protein